MPVRASPAHRMTVTKLRRCITVYAINDRFGMCHTHNNTYNISVRECTADNSMIVTILRICILFVCTHASSGIACTHHDSDKIAEGYSCVCY